MGFYKDWSSTYYPLSNTICIPLVPFCEPLILCFCWVIWICCTEHSVSSSCFWPFQAGTRHNGRRRGWNSPHVANGLVASCHLKWAVRSHRDEGQDSPRCHHIACEVCFPGDCERIPSLQNLAGKSLLVDEMLPIWVIEVYWCPICCRQFIEFIPTGPASSLRIPLYRPLDRPEDSQEEELFLLNLRSWIKLHKSWIVWIGAQQQEYQYAVDQSLQF